jgi:hypothetical protein
MAFRTVFGFTLPIKAGYAVKVRSRTYAIPRGSFFVQINLMDMPEIEDCSKHFDIVTRNIKIKGSATEEQKVTGDGSRGTNH